MKYLLKWLGIGPIIAALIATVVTLFACISYLICFVFRFLWSFELYSYEQYQQVEELDKEWFVEGYTVHDKTPLDTWLRHYRTFYHFDISYLES
jgi:hypothetical protein